METKIRFEPTLFFFLGTSSVQIGWRLKRLLHQAYGDVPILRFLWVDTDNTVDPVAARWFTDDERVELSGFNGDEVLANLQMFPAIRAWWPVDARLKPGFIRRGANQTRLFGRLSLFRMFNDRMTGPAFIDKLRAHLEALQQIVNFDATERMGRANLRYEVERNSVRIVIFYSTCGGTGSSMSFDLAYLCRSLLRNSNATIVSIALLPPIMDKAIKNETHTQWEKIRANTYAWFKEHEYLLQNPYWRVNYPEGAPVGIQALPFDLTFLVDLGNQAGDRLSSEDDIFSMVAQAVFLDTGSSISGAIRGFNANVSVLMEEFQGRQRAYSALAAASLIFPAEKILNYCCARLSQTLVREVILAEPDPKEVAEAASALLGRLQVRDAQLISELLEGRQISNLNTPAIRKATNVPAIHNLLVSQELEDTQERHRQAKQIGKRAAGLLEQAVIALQQEITTMVLEQGVRFSQAVLEALIAGREELVGIQDTDSLPGLKHRLANQGISEEELAQAQAAFQEAKERLLSLDGDTWQVLWRLVSKRSWRQELDKARGDCLIWLAELNQQSLQLAAQREAANLYDQLLEQARSLQAILAGTIQNASRAAKRLEEIAQENLDPDGLEQGIYALSLEAVDADYIRDYYSRHSASIDPRTVYQEFTRTSSAVALPDLAGWDELSLIERLQTHARRYFKANLEDTSLLDALAAYFGDRAPAVIESLFDRLVRYCHPFWQYQRDSGIQGQEGKSLIGVEDEHSELVPPRFRDSLQYEIKSTGFKHRIDVARVQHGLPAFLLRGMPEYKAYYDSRRKGLDPLHILPGAAHAAEVIPDERQEARHTFAVACAFGYIVQIGSWYYFDPTREYASRNIHPGRGNRLGQGRENAEEAFIQRDELVRLAEGMVEAEIERMGNLAAITLLEKQIDAAKGSIASMGSVSTAENGLRRQLENEVKALAEKQRQLGHIRAELNPFPEDGR